MILPDDFGRNLVEDLHRLDNADRGLRPDVVAHFHEGGRLGIGRRVEGADNRALDHRDVGVVGLALIGRGMRRCGRRSGNGSRGRTRRSDRNHRVDAAAELNPRIPFADVDLAQVVLFHELDQAANPAQVENVLVRRRTGHTRPFIALRMPNKTGNRANRCTAKAGFVQTSSGNYHLLKLLGEARQDFVPIAGDEYVVFNADTAPTRNIHPRFDGNDHPRLEHRGVLACHPRQLVNLQAEPVPDAVIEAASKTGFRNHVAGGCIYFRSGYAWSNGRDGPRLRTEHNFIHATKFGRDFTGHKHPRQVAIVEPPLRPPIDQQNFAITDLVIG